MLVIGYFPGQSRILINRSHLTSEPPGNWLTCFGIITQRLWIGAEYPWLNRFERFGHSRLSFVSMSFIPTSSLYPTRLTKCNEHSKMMFLPVGGPRHDP
ncbi:hypothetical protein AcV5_001934 [Taiwanofungus camphoratus]|nr:hypothetical protein AcV5_001934 [Antrodia cinnamomea]KAI0925461.1 hypothetical protein AcV7_005711 [Antrodia cinnamomea]